MGPFQVLSDQRESAILVGEGERYRIRLVVLAREGSLTLATFVQSRGRAWRELLRGILVGHRRVAPLLLERAVARKARNHRSASEEPAQDDIRPCPPERLEEVISLWREAETEPTVTDDVKSLERLLAADPGALLVAIEDDRVIGTLVAAWNGWRGSLYRLAVLPGWRRRGVAMRLLRAGEERLMGLGAKRIDAVVLADNAHALAFWRAAGYTRQRGRARLVKNSPL